MKKNLYVFIFLLTATFAHAQNITGPSPVYVNTTQQYVFNDGNVYTNYIPLATNGTVASITANGSAYTITVNWTTVGTGSVKFKQLDNGVSIVGTKSVTVQTCPVPATPTATFSYANNCGNTVITTTGTTGTPPANTIWYWQTSQLGTSMTTNSTSSYTVTGSQIYYLRPYSTCGTWGNTTTGTTSEPTANVTIKVIPTAAASNQTICSGTATNITITNPNNVSGTTFSWTQTSQASITGAANGSGSTIAQTLTNSSNSTAGTTTYSITPTANGCSGTAVNAVETVNPKPVASAPSKAIFSGSTTSVALSSTAAGSTFAYTVSSSNVSGATSGSGSTIAQALTTTDGVNPGTATYTITPTANSCTGTTATSVVSVYPVPVLKINGATAPSTVYLNYGYGLTLTASPFYYSYQWNKNGVAIIGATQSSYSPTGSGALTLTVQATATSPFSTSATVNVIKPDGQADSVNMVSYLRIYKPGQTASSSLYTLLPTDLAQAITYKDGLGRTVQTVALGQAANGGDLIAPSVYSKNGFADSTLLPYATATTQGNFHKNAVRGSAAYNSYNTSEQYLFYQGTLAEASKVAVDGYPFARVRYRNTPDARVLEQGAPGSDWQLGAHTITSQVTLSTSTNLPVRLWKADGTTSGNYPDRTVVVAITTDENSHLVRTYTDKRGLTVLKQVQSDVNTWLETYYIYDIYGQLIYQVPPLAMTTLGTGNALDANNTSVAELIYKYTYDVKGRLIEKKVPGSVVQWAVYDQLDRPVLTQDGNQREKGKWTFVKYDFKNRPVYAGLYTSASDRATLQNLFDTTYDYTNPTNTNPYFETRAVNATYQGYTNTVFPTTNIQLLTVTYYDDYDFDSNGTADYAYDNTHFTEVTANLSTSTRGLATGSKKVILDASGNVTANWLVSVVFYDNLDRPLQTQSNNHLNLNVQDRATIKYKDLAHVDKTKVTHSGATTVNVIQRYTYDIAWRTTGIFHSIDGATEQQLAKYEYNSLGQLVDKKLHVASNGSFIQSVDYRYHIRGWLKSINNAQLTSDGVMNDDATDYFGTELFYNTAESSGPNNNLNNGLNYNGNISAMKWKNAGTTSGVADQRSYKYAYDMSDKLLSATFQANTGSAWTKEAGTLDENMAYDVNGNITTLTRKQNQRGLNGTMVTSTAQAIDNLTYAYTGNQLIKVTDSAPAQGGFLDGANATTEYTYNTQGSLIKDDNKGISNITYNVLGKAQQVTFIDGRVINYTYDASGNKLKTSTTVSGTTTITDYVGSYVYSNNALSFFSSPEGRVVKNGSNYEYQYAISDHQGNTRVVFTSATPVADTKTATFESNESQNVKDWYGTSYPSASHINSTGLGPNGSSSLLLDGGYAGQVGLAKSFRVRPGDVVSISTEANYIQPQYPNTNVIGLAAQLINALNLPTPAPGETGTESSGISWWGGQESSSCNDCQSSYYPRLFVTILLFDKNHNFLDFSAQQYNGTSTMAANYTVKEDGFAYLYVSNENVSQVNAYFDNVTISNTPSRIIQSNEYYPFGLQTANSWTRDNNVANNFLYNGPTETNTTTGLIETSFRGYDPILGRFNQVDPLASLSSNYSPYSYASNNPVLWNDPTGLITMGQLVNMWNSTDANGMSTWSNSEGFHYFVADGNGSLIETKGYGSTYSGGPSGMMSPIYKITGGSRVFDSGTQSYVWREYKELVGFSYEQPDKTEDGGCPPGMKCEYDEKGNIKRADPIHDPDKLPPSYNANIQLGYNILKGVAIGASSEIGGYFIGRTFFWALNAIRAAQAAKAATITVLGRYPAYLNLANHLGANKLNLPKGVQWTWEINQKFLDDAIVRGDKFVLSSNGFFAEAGTVFEREINYLISKGYQIAEDGMSMIKPK
jgi:RHS repeat-associated protein